MPATSTPPSAAAHLLADATALQDAGRDTDAIALLRNLVALAPDHVEGWSRLGWLLSRRGDHDGAIAAHRQAIALSPGFAGAWSNLGIALQAKGAHDEALDALSRAVTLDPRAAEAQVNLGLEWQQRGATTAALQAFATAVALQPARAESWINVATLLHDLGDVPLARAASGRALALAPADRAARANRQMTNQYAGAPTVAALKRDARAAGIALGDAGPATNPATPRDGPLRVGYVSGDLYAHPVGWMASRALCAHDPRRVEVHCFADQTRDDELTQAIRAAVAHWHPVRALDDDALLAFVRQSGIDVLVDLSGHTAANRLGVFARRAAPVQLGWLGFAASTGLTAMDGIVLDAAMAPPGSECAFVEPLVRLPRPHVTYTPPGYAPAVASPPAARADHITFGSFNNTAKLGGDVIALWARVLHGVPRSRLLLKWRSLADAGVADRLRRQFAAHGIALDRLDLRGASPHADMLGQYGEVDIALDPFPYSGGLTTCEALWMGVPVVTLPWLRPLSRQGVMLLGAVGLGELVASTPRDYLDIAVRLAGDEGKRAAWRASLRERMAASSLFDGAGLARCLEDTYARMYAARCTP